MSRRTTTGAFLGATVGALGLPVTALAVTVAFQDPGPAAWGDWNRGTAGSVYVHYDAFGNPPPLGTAPVLPDTTPDKGNFGTLTNGAILLTKKKGSTAAPAAFITGSANIYSFSDILDFDLIVQPTAAHTALGTHPITVALQVAVLGSDLDDTSVKLLGQTFSSKIVLHEGSASGPGGEGTGVDNEYLYLWHLNAASSVYTFDFAAVSTSLSLEAVAVDIGPATIVVPPVEPPPTTPIPLPAPMLMLGAALMALSGRRALERQARRAWFVSSSGREPAQNR